MFYKYLMDKYNWNPSEIRDLNYWKTYDLEFGEWNDKKNKEVVYQYADELPF